MCAIGGIGICPKLPLPPARIFAAIFAVSAAVYLAATSAKLGRIFLASALPRPWQAAQLALKVVAALVRSGPGAAGFVASAASGEPTMTAAAARLAAR